MAKANYLAGKKYAKSTYSNYDYLTLLKIRKSYINKANNIDINKTQGFAKEIMNRIDFYCGVLDVINDRIKKYSSRRINE